MNTIVHTKADKVTKKLPLEFKQKFHIPTSSTTIDITISIFYYLKTNLRKIQGKLTGGEDIETLPTFKNTILQAFNSLKPFNIKRNHERSNSC